MERQEGEGPAVAGSAQDQEVAAGGRDGVEPAEVEIGAAQLGARVAERRPGLTVTGGKVAPFQDAETGHRLIPPPGRRARCAPPPPRHRSGGSSTRSPCRGPGPPCPPCRRAAVNSGGGTGRRRRHRPAPGRRRRPSSSPCPP